jgi:hypothetical protein
MASVATPPPVAAAPQPLVPPLNPNHLHSKEDRIDHALRASAAAPPSLPVAPLTPAAAAAPAETPATPEAPAVATPVETPPVEKELDLESVDFDAEDAPETEAPPIEATPAEDTTEPYKALQKALEAGEIPDEVQAKLIKTNKGKELLETWKITRELRKPVAEGGIGHYPTVDEIKLGYGHTQDMNGIRFDFENNPASFVKNLLIPDASGATYIGQGQHAAQVLRAIPQELLRAGQHELFEKAYLAPALGLLLDNKYQTALAMPDGAEKARMLDSLQVFEWDTFGEARPLPGITAPAATAGRTDDPEFKRLKQERDAAVNLVNRQTAMQQRSVVSHLDSANRDQGFKDVDKLVKVAGLKNVYSDELLKPFVREVFETVHNEIMGFNGQPADPGMKQAYERELRAALANGGDTSKAREIYQRMFRARLQTHPDIKSRFTVLVSAGKSRSDSALTAAQASQARTEPVGSGTPAPAPVVSLAGQATRQPGETKEEALVRQLNAVASLSPRR